jgi:hypothetical protein
MKNQNTKSKHLTAAQKFERFFDSLPESKAKRRIDTPEPIRVVITIELVVSPPMAN